MRPWLLLALVAAVACGSSNSGSPAGPVSDAGRDADVVRVELALDYAACGGAGTFDFSPTTMTSTQASGPAQRWAFPVGTVVTVTAKPDAYSAFDGWSGSCSGTGACVVTMDAAKSVGVLFRPATGGAPFHIISSSGDDDVRSLAIDGADATVVAGSLGGAFDFGSGVLGADGATSSFLAKYAAAGSLAWAKTIPGDVLAARLTKTGGIVAAGRLDGIADFGGGPIGTAGTHVPFLAGFDQSGAHLWSMVLGKGPVAVTQLALDPATDDVVVAGSYEAGADLGGGVLSPATGLYVARFAAADRALQWVHPLAAKVFYRVESLVVDAAGDVLVGGHFEQGMLDLGGPVLDASGATVGASFLAKLHKADGTHAWSKAFVGGGHNDIPGVAILGGNGLALFGNVGGKVSFGGPTLAAGNVGDYVLARLGADGAHVWSKLIVGPYVEDARAIAVDPQGNLAIAATFEKGVTLGLGAGELPQLGTPDIFVAKMSAADGSHTWSRRFGCAGDKTDTNDVRGIAVDSSGETRFVGTFTGAIDLGDGAHAAKKRDGFVAGVRVK